MPLPVGTWTTVELRPLDDLTAIFTELPAAADNATTAQVVTNNIVLTVGAGARNGGVGRGWFDRLRFLRDGVGAAAYDLQEQLIARYATVFSSVRGHLGDEISRNDPHLQWLVGRPVPIDYDYKRWPNTAEVLKAINGVHQGGGLLQYNHPFGAEASGSFTDQNALLTQAVSLMKTSGAWPLLDLVEAGYQRRGTNTNMASLDTHLRLFDLLARSRRYVTCTGCTDDHEGLIGSWSSRTNRYATGIWAPSLADADVRAALASGQAWCLEVEDSGTVNTIDLMADGVVPMGSVSVRPVATRTAQLTCPTVPSGATAEFIRGVVDGNDSDLTHRVTTFATADDRRPQGRHGQPDGRHHERLLRAGADPQLWRHDRCLLEPHLAPPGGATRWHSRQPSGSRRAAGHHDLGSDDHDDGGHDHDDRRNDHDDGGPDHDDHRAVGCRAQHRRDDAGGRIASGITRHHHRDRDRRRRRVFGALRDPRPGHEALAPARWNVWRLHAALRHVGRSERQVDGVLGERRPAAR